MWQLLFNFFFYAFCYNMCKFEGRQKLPAFVGKPGEIQVTIDIAAKTITVN